MRERIRQASTVVLTRSAGADLQVYLVLRAPELRFYGGYWAFPGGVFDAELDAFDGSTFDSRVPTEHPTREACAVRELFEETGVLLGDRPRSLGGAERERLRRELVSKSGAEVAGPWRAALERAGVRTGRAPAFARVLTPAFSPLRYDTTFHHARLPAGEEPVPDGSEAIEGRFFEPADLLARWRSGELFVVPPVLYLLEHLVAHGLEAGLQRAGESCRSIAAGRPFGSCQSPGILVVPLRTPTIPPATTTNAYLVGAESTYVIDPATTDEEERERLFRLCDELRDAGRRIAGVLLTHHHRDHVGSAVAVARRYGVAVAAHPDTHTRVDLGSTPREALSDGDELPLGTAPDGSPGWSLRALFTPGHAPGHLAFVESYLRGAIVGDLVSTLSTIVVDPPEGHMATYLASLRRLLEEDIRVLHPAHGLPTRDGPGAVRHVLAHRTAREEKLAASLSGRPRALSSLVEEVYDDVPEPLRGLARRSLLAGLEKLREEGRATRSAAGWSSTRAPLRADPDARRAGA